MGATLAALHVTPASVGLVINSLLGQQPVQLTVTGTLGDGSTVDLTRAVGTSYRSLTPQSSSWTAPALVATPRAVAHPFAFCKSPT